MILKNSLEIQIKREYKKIEVGSSAKFRSSLPIISKFFLQISELVETMCESNCSEINIEKMEAFKTAIKSLERYKKAVQFAFNLQAQEDKNGVVNYNDFLREISFQKQFLTILDSIMTFHKQNILTVLKDIAQAETPIPHEDDRI